MDVILKKDFDPEPRRLYSVRVVAYGYLRKRKVIKRIPLTVYVKENQDFFIKGICTRCENTLPKIRNVYCIEIFYLRKAGFIQSDV